MRKTRTATFIVVVVRADGRSSQRPYGDYASFVADNREEAISMAQSAQEAWERLSGTKYKLLVGTLTHEVKPLVDYTLIEI